MLPVFTLAVLCAAGCRHAKSPPTSDAGPAAAAIPRIEMSAGNVSSIQYPGRSKIEVVTSVPVMAPPDKHRHTGYISFKRNDEPPQLAKMQALAEIDGACPNSDCEFLCPPPAGARFADDTLTCVMPDGTLDGPWAKYSRKGDELVLGEYKDGEKHGLWHSESPATTERFDYGKLVYSNAPGWTFNVTLTSVQASAIGTQRDRLVRALDSMQQRVSRCFERQLLIRPGLYGTLAMTLETDRRGRVTGAQAAFPNRSVTSCAVRSAKELTSFPAQLRDVEVRFTLSHHQP